MNKREYHYIYKNSDRCYYGVSIKEGEKIEGDNDHNVEDPYFETSWEIAIYKEMNKIPIYESEINEQWDEVPSIQTVLMAWMAYVNDLCLGLNKYGIETSKDCMNKELCFKGKANSIGAKS